MAPDSIHKRRGARSRRPLPADFVWGNRIGAGTAPRVRAAAVCPVVFVSALRLIGRTGLAVVRRREDCGGRDPAGADDDGP